MFLFLFLFGLTLGAESPAGDHEMKLQRGNCPEFWHSFHGRCYKYVATRMTWANAELHCVSEKANLVSIHNLEEQEFVTSLIKIFDHTEGPTWIGLSDVHKEDKWMWSDGCAVDFVLWFSGEPNDDRNEDCVHTNLGTGRKWNDEKCYKNFPSVCASRTICP